MMVFPIASTPSRWRDPIIAWQAMRACFALAMIVYALSATATLAVLAYAYGHLPTEAYYWLDQSYSVLSVANLWVWTITFLALLVLTYILVGNAHSSGRHASLPSPTMAIATYFIPIGNFVLPPQMMGDLWRATQAKEPRGRIAWWRTAVITSGGLSLFAFSSWEEAYEFAVAISIASDVAAIAAAVLTLWVFSALVTAEERADDAARSD